MAPKAAPKAKADAKAAAKKQPKKEKSPEEEKPKVQQPDQEAHQANLQVIQDAIDVLQKKMATLSAQIKDRSGGKEEFFQKKAEIRCQLDEISEKINGLQARKDEIQKTIGDKRQEQVAMRGELNKMKKSMNYGSEEQIDDRIASIEFKLWTDSLTLKEEKKYLAEIQELKRSKPKVSQVAGMEEKLQTFDSGLSLKEQNKQLNEEMAKLRDQRSGIQEKYKALQEDRQKQLGDLPDIIAQREALGKEIAAKIAERNELKDKFNEEKRAFQAYLAEQREARRAKYEEERQEKQKQWKQEQLRRDIEKMDEQPHSDEILLIEQTIKFCKSLLPQDAVEKQEEKKETVHNTKDNEVVLAKKSDRDEEYYFAPTKKGKSKKSKGSSADAGGAKPIKHNAVSFQLFDKLKLNAPITTADIPKLLEELDGQLADYQEKVKKWEEEKEEKKRILMEGGTLPEDEKEEAEEDAEEEKEDNEEDEAKPEEEEEDKEEEKEEEEEAKED